MDYISIVKRAYEITIKHRYLWIFGIFAGGLAGGFRGFNLNLPSESQNQNFDKTLPDFTQKIADFWTQYWGVVVVLGILLFLFILLWWIMAVISQGALLGSVEEIEKHKENNFSTGFRFGWHKFWKVFLTSLIFGLAILISLIVWWLPVILFIIAKAYVLAVLYGLLFFLADLVLWVVLGFVYPYTLRIAVLEDKGVIEAYRDSWDFFQKHWKEIIIMYLFLLAISIGIGIGLFIVGLVLAALLFGIGLALYLASQIAAYLFAGVAILAFGILMLVVGGVINTFSSSVVTLTYLELKKRTN